MRRARTVRVSNPHNVCVFCATRQLAVGGYAANPLPQRRQLNSSSNPHNNAADAQLYKEEKAPSRPLTPREQMLLMRKQFAIPQQQQQQQQQQQSLASHLSQAERPRSALPHSPVRQQTQQRPPPQRASSIFDGPGRNHGADRYAQNRGEQRQPRYTVNMGARPPPVQTPQFGSTAHLRRRNDSPARASFPPSEDGAQQQATSQIRQPPPLRPKLDKDELARLLGGDTQTSKSEVPKVLYTPLTRQPRGELTCFTCGQKGHGSRDCPDKGATGQPPRMQRYVPPAKESLADAAEAWIQKKGTSLEMDQMTRSEQEERRKAEEGRRSRFRMDDGAPLETRNRYEEPARRRPMGDQRRARGRVMRDDDEEDDKVISKMERKRLRKEAKKAAQLAKAGPTPISIPEYISVSNLANLLRLRVEDFIKKLEELGFEDVQNDHILNAEHAGLIAQEYNFEPVVQAEGEDGDLYPAPPLTPEEYAKLPPRPPVVTIMGHVDHGKTTILDYMRSSSVAATEFGGITQHIGAFSVPLKSGKKITFLDTPGHAAFETMRARGANVTDIVVLVVAADDSVMPQTVEAIKHAQAAKVPIIVAVNKIDKQQADPDRVKLDLGRHGVDVEDFGGDVQAVCVSGKTGQGIEDLEDAITLLSEVLDHRADPNSNVEGWVLEGTTKKSGRVATVLVRSGTLRTGDFLVAGNTWTRVRSLRNEAGVAVKEVGPGMPVEVDGWREQPIAGDEVLQAADEAQAASVAELRQEKLERAQMAIDMEAINEARRLEAERREAEEAEKNGEAPVEQEVKESGPEVVSFIVKGDVSGSVEAVIDSVSAIGNAEVATRILRSGVGSPSEFDVQHAADANGHIVNFNTVVPQHISGLAEEKGVKILDSNIIYRVVDEVKALLSEKLPPRITQRVTGEAEIAAVFEIGLGGRKTLKVAGSKVRNGVVEKGGRAKVLRGEEVVFDGVINSLKSQKKDVEQMRKDTECGIGFADWEDFKVGDRIQCYEEKSERRTL